MKALLIFSLLGVVLLPPEFVHASPSPADSLHFSTFTSTAGDGTFSGRFKLEKATTGADGRAQGVLTLGRDQGTNTFEATVPGLELLTFNAVGVGTPSNPEMEGDFQRWHLPPGAILRLGKGRIGTGDRVVVFSPDGLLLAVGSEIGVWLYEVATSGELALLPAAPVAAVAFAPDGAMLASAGSYGDRSVKLWDLATANLLETIDLEADALAFSPDGTTLACGSKYGIDLWDLATGTRTATISHEQNAWGINSLAFSPDGTTLASGSWSDYFVRLWDGPQLRQNAPNPFNSETVISWFLLRPGPARVEVYALTGQRVAVLHQGLKNAGVHRVHWDGHDDRGRPLASGVYLYRLVTDERVQTRKLTLLR